MFTSILDTTSLTISTASICTAISILLGLVISFIYMKSGTSSKNFVTTLVLLPALIQVVIMMVNGNLGTGVAVLGAFSLVRFRSVPGSSREISSIFFAMAIGLATGMGYVTFAVMITVVIGLVIILLNKTHFGEIQTKEKELKITIAENLNYTDIFDDIFSKFTTKVSLERVKTTNLGSMYELAYHIELKDLNLEKQMIDELRCRNGNLPIICNKTQTVKDEL